MQISFMFNTGERVRVKGFGTYGYITMAAVGLSGEHSYFVRSEKRDDWFVEKELERAK